MADGGAPLVVPLSAVPILLQLLTLENNPNREEALGLLCDLVATAYGAQGEEVGHAVRRFVRIGEEFQHHAATAARVDAQLEKLKELQVRLRQRGPLPKK